MPKDSSMHRVQLEIPLNRDELDPAESLEFRFQEILNPKTSYAERLYRSGLKNFYQQLLQISIHEVRGLTNLPTNIINEIGILVDANDKLGARRFVILKADLEITSPRLQGIINAEAGDVIVETYADLQTLKAIWHFYIGVEF